ncbi:hypothetical protein [Rhizobium sp. IMFF44]|uniref:hypothetical protein n=1 Tax=Rhizobium sp. IMFF44 TaxID=3342350 RepID=UPI0035B8E69A
MQHCSGTGTSTALLPPAIGSDKGPLATIAPAAVSHYDVIETPGYVEHTECFYTFYTRGVGSDRYVTSFRQPSLECE